MVDTVTVPFDAPLHNTFVSLIVAAPSTAGWLIVTVLEVEVHP